MNRKLSVLLRQWRQASVLAIGVTVALQGAYAAEEAADDKADADKAKPAEKAEKAETSEKSEEKKEAPTEYRNWVDVSVGGVMVDGDKAAFQRRYGLPASAFGGVEEFHYEQDVGKKGIFKVDGRGVFDNHDYSLKFDVEHPDIGYVRGGYTEFRSYYDGSGGFFGPTGTWTTPFDDRLELDRGDFFFETGLTLPNKPIVTFRYDHQFRDGQKDSTAWGDLNIPGYGIRKVIPGFWDIDETRDIFAGDVKHTLGNTTFGLGLRYEMSSNDDSRNMLRTGPGNGHVTQRDEVDSDMLNMHVFSETRFNEKLMFTSGYAYTTLDSDLGGYRVYGTAYDPSFGQRLPAAATFDNLDGGSDLQQHVANLNLAWQLADSLYLVPSLRIEQENTDSSVTYGSPAAPMSGFPYGADSDRRLLDVSERVELRYTGVTNWVFYTRGEWLEGSGDLSEHWNNLGTLSPVVNRSTDDSRFWQTYTVGANWYPMKRLNFGAQYYHKERSTDYDHTVDSTPNSLSIIPTSVYPAFLNARNWSTDDANLRVTWRPLNTLTLVARYDIQFSTINTTPDSASGLSKVESAYMSSHIVGGTASWTPLARLYLQAGVNWVYDETDTPADEVTQAIQKARNNYWTINSSVGYALTDKTDLQLQYLYYQANNFENNYAYGMPYGADATEHGITAGVVHRINDRMRVSVKYGFFDGEDGTSGNHNDYQAHLVYTSLHTRF